MINKFIYITTALVTLALLLCVFTGMGIMLCEQRQQALTLEIRQLQDDVRKLNKVVMEHEEIMVTYQFFNEHWDAILRESLKAKGSSHITKEE